MILALGGACRLDSSALEPKRLDVEVRFPPGSWRPGTLQVDFKGTVHLEGSAANAEATGEVRIVSRSARYRFDFSADDGTRLSLVLSQSFARLTLRSLTELAGSLVARDTRTVLGQVRLRFDVRRALGI